jgi:hypothetical protein
MKLGLSHDVAPGPATKHYLLLAHEIPRERFWALAPAYAKSVPRTRRNSAADKARWATAPYCHGRFWREFEVHHQRSTNDTFRPIVTACIFWLKNRDPRPTRARAANHTSAPTATATTWSRSARSASVAPQFRQRFCELNVPHACHHCGPAKPMHTEVSLGR